MYVSNREREKERKRERERERERDGRGAVGITHDLVSRCRTVNNKCLYPASLSSSLPFLYRVNEPAATRTVRAASTGKQFHYSEIHDDLARVVNGVEHRQHVRNPFRVCLPTFVSLSLSLSLSLSFFPPLSLLWVKRGDLTSFFPWLAIAPDEWALHTAGSVVIGNAIHRRGRVSPQFADGTCIDGDANWMINYETAFLCRGVWAILESVMQKWKIYCSVCIVIFATM